MFIETELTHESTLIGAVDSFLKELVHVRPFLLQRYSAVLEGMAERWIDEIGVNQLGAIDPKWLGNYIATSRDRGLCMNAFQDFYRWAMQRDLIVENPLGGVIS